MKITNARINGIENPIGFSYDYLLCSWNVEEAQGKKQISYKEVENGHICDYVECGQYTKSSR